MNLILLDPDELGEDGTATVSGVRARHLQQVLKVALGDRVRVGALDGGTGLATVISLQDGTVSLRCAIEEMSSPRPAVDLLLALPRPKVLQRLWAQLAAIGVGQIILTNAERVERNYFDTHVLTPACYRPLLIEGLQQARDTRLPLVSIHRRFKVLIEDDLDRLFEGGVRLVAHPTSQRSIGDVVAEYVGERILLAVGPEGGWNDFELKLLAGHGFAAVGFGPRTLRSDTACLALLAIAHEASRQRGR